MIVSDVVPETGTKVSPKVTGNMTKATPKMAPEKVQGAPVGSSFEYKGNNIEKTEKGWSINGRIVSPAIGDSLESTLNRIQKNPPAYDRSMGDNRIEPTFESKTRKISNRNK